MHEHEWEVESKEQAWEEVKKMLPNQIEKAKDTSDLLKCNTYIHRGYYCDTFIYDFKDKLKIFFGDSEGTLNIWIKSNRREK